MSKKNKQNVWKSLGVSILIVILSPVILVWWIVRVFTKRTRVEDLSKMEDFELSDFFKYLYFYQGFNVKDVSMNKNEVNMRLSKGEISAVLKYNTLKHISHLKNIDIIIESMKKNNIPNGVYITTY